MIIIDDIKLNNTNKMITLTFEPVGPGMCEGDEYAKLSKADSCRKRIQKISMPELPYTRVVGVDSTKL